MIVHFFRRCFYCFKKEATSSEEAHIMKRTAYTKRNKTDSLEAQFHFSSSFVTRESHLFMLYL